MRNMQVMRCPGLGIGMAAGRRSSGASSSADNGDGPSLADYLEFGAQQGAHGDGPHRSDGTVHGGGAACGCGLHRDHAPLVHVHRPVSCGAGRLLGEKPDDVERGLQEAGFLAAQDERAQQYLQG